MSVWLGMTQSKVHGPFFFAEATFNIRMDLQEVGCGYVDWIGLAQDRDRWRKLVSAVMNLRVSQNAGNFLTSLKPVNFSRRTLHQGRRLRVASRASAPGPALEGAPRFRPMSLSSYILR